jgi:cell division protein FtsB
MIFRRLKSESCARWKWCATRTEAQLSELTAHIEQSEKELGMLRAERDHVRERVDRLLAQLDALEL